MKKTIKTIVAVSLALALVFSFAACSVTGPYKAKQDVYAFVSTTNTASHSGLAFVNIKTDKNGEISDIIFDEAFFPQEWARVNEADKAKLGDANVLASTSTRDGTTTTTWLPKYLTFDGVDYVGKQVNYATDTAATNPATSCAVRYFAGTETKSLETKLGEDDTLAKKYIDILRNKQYSKIKFGSGTNGATKLDVVRAKSTADTGNKIKLGAPTATTDAEFDAIMNGTYTTESGGTGLAYATTFFKGEDVYSPRFKTSTGATWSGNSVWSVGAERLIEYVNEVGIANLTTAMVTAATKATTGVSMGNLNEYLQLFVDAHAKLAANPKYAAE